jgi:hypothetical protein
LPDPKVNIKLPSSKYDDAVMLWSFGFNFLLPTMLHQTHTYNNQPPPHTPTHNNTFPIWGCFAQQRQPPGGTNVMSEMDLSSVQEIKAVEASAAVNGSYGPHC